MAQTYDNDGQKYKNLSAEEPCYTHKVRNVSICLAIRLQLSLFLPISLSLFPPPAAVGLNAIIKIHSRIYFDL